MQLCSIYRVIVALMLVRGFDSWTRPLLTSLNKISSYRSRVSFGTALRMVPDAIVSPFDSSAGQPVAGATITEYVSGHCY